MAWLTGQHKPVRPGLAWLTVAGWISRCRGMITSSPLAMLARDVNSPLPCCGAGAVARGGGNAGCSAACARGRVCCFPNRPSLRMAAAHCQARSLCQAGQYAVIALHWHVQG